MTAPIGPISRIGGMTPVNTELSATRSAGAAGGEDFASKLSAGLEHVQGMQNRTEDMQVQAATGSLKDVHDYMIASAESGIATSLTVAVRNKAIEAFQEIMRMQA
jgi:flagellar hook-basal body complex protein FliE